MNAQINNLTQFVANKIPVSIYLVTGIRLRGVLTDFDDETLCLFNKKPLLIYKHSVSTVIED